MPTNFTVVPVEARADGSGDEAAERTEELGSPESADPACPTSGELGGTCRGTKAEAAGPSRRRWAAPARWGAAARGPAGACLVLRGVTRDPERVLGLVVCCWSCPFRP
ncbi:Slc12a7 [Phodopus roborovskii]|uniref:Slc12a7 protein n=1 Tax=Phodopus roborovskii TaxID=109678 RepID=A0AAU9Z6I4_PHORO|nr:Slc12a7 [Phodopus roborovskii]